MTAPGQPLGRWALSSTANCATALPTNATSTSAPRPLPNGYPPSTTGIDTRNLKDFHMMMNNTLAQLRDLKLAGMASAVEEQLSSNASISLSFEERLALMVDREVHHRDDKRRTVLLKKAGLKYPQACIEDVDSKPGRGLERSSLMSLASGPRRGPCVALCVGSGTARRLRSAGRRGRGSPGRPSRRARHSAYRQVAPCRARC